MKIVEYNTLYNDSRTELTNEINIEIGKGWQPLGGIMAWASSQDAGDFYFWQAMVKYEMDSEVNITPSGSIKIVNMTDVNSEIETLEKEKERLEKLDRLLKNIAQINAQCIKRQIEKNEQIKEENEKLAQMFRVEHQKLEECQESYAILCEENEQLKEKNENLIGCCESYKHQGQLAIDESKRLREQLKYYQGPIKSDELNYEELAKENELLKEIIQDCIATHEQIAEYGAYFLIVEKMYRFESFDLQKEWVKLTNKILEDYKEKNKNENNN